MDSYGSLRIEKNDDMEDSQWLNEDEHLNRYTRHPCSFLMAADPEWNKNTEENITQMDLIHTWDWIVQNTAILLSK